MDNMTDIEDRLKTFKGRYWWSKDCDITCREMACAGFFYLGTEKGRGYAVKCAYCNIVIDHDWPIGSDPMSEHKRYSKCRYIEEMLKYPFEPTNNSCRLLTLSQSFHSQLKYQKQNNDSKKDSEYFYRCVICLDNERQIMFQPCHHVVCCRTCSDLITDCVICRSVIIERVIVFLN
ncbi:iap3 [Hemileuca sp. nucleopolyhedrovirus]|uniref:Iap3 n=1 Tax=Hemileuca sp. nucleopolyhedrovirus TaxID=1367203 RepID=S5MQA6_9ABAC|nr:iap3 [Hemileuca sp. nucleopolyhedrovirus]AGR56853.1 iap3 [Hemileuca sp. nucleopolyhedrovirus]